MAETIQAPKAPEASTVAPKAEALKAVAQPEAQKAASTVSADIAAGVRPRSIIDKFLGRNKQAAPPPAPSQSITERLTLDDKGNLVTEFKNETGFTVDEHTARMNQAGEPVSIRTEPGPDGGLRTVAVNALGIEVPATPDQINALKNAPALESTPTPQQTAKEAPPAQSTGQQAAEKTTAQPSPDKPYDRIFQTRERFFLVNNQPISFKQEDPVGLELNRIRNEKGDALLTTADVENARKAAQAKAEAEQAQKPPEAQSAASAAGSIRSNEGNNNNVVNEQTLAQRLASVDLNASSFADDLAGEPATPAGAKAEKPQTVTAPVVKVEAIPVGSPTPDLSRENISTTPPANEASDKVYPRDGDSGGAAKLSETPAAPYAGNKTAEQAAAPAPAAEATAAAGQATAEQPKDQTGNKAEAETGQPKAEEQKANEERAKLKAELKAELKSELKAEVMAELGLGTPAEYQQTLVALAEVIAKLNLLNGAEADKKEENKDTKKNLPQLLMMLTLLLGKLLTTMGPAAVKNTVNAN